MSSVPGFLSKTFEIFSNPEFSDCCGWGNDGTTIVIRKYDFHKTVQDPTHGEFQHQYFKQGRPDLLVNIKRKAHHRTLDPTKKIKPKSNNESLLDRKDTVNLSSIGDESGLDNIDDLVISPPPTSQKVYPSSSTLSSSMSTRNLKGKAVNESKNPYATVTTKLPHMSATSSIPNNIRHQPIPPSITSLANDSRKEMLESFQPPTMADIARRLKELESQANRLSNENVMLKRMVLESRTKQVRMQEKMEKVLKLLYNVFVGTTGKSPTHGSSDLAVIPAPGRSKGFGNAGVADSEGIPLQRRSSLNTLLESVLDEGGTVSPAWGDADSVPFMKLYPFSSSSSAFAGKELTRPQTSFDAFASAVTFESKEENNPEMSRQLTPFGLSPRDALFDSALSINNGFGDDLKRENSLFSNIEDDVLALSRSNSLEAWQVFGSNENNTSSNESGAFSVNNSPRGSGMSSQTDADSAIDTALEVAEAAASKIKAASDAKSLNDIKSDIDDRVLMKRTRFEVNSNGSGGTDHETVGRYDMKKIKIENENHQDGVPLARMDSLDATLASLLDGEIEPGTPLSLSGNPSELVGEDIR